MGHRSQQVGLAIWLVGLVMEAVADQQKFDFRNDPRNAGQWCQSGLWRSSLSISLSLYLSLSLSLSRARAGSLNVIQLAIGHPPPSLGNGSRIVRVDDGNGEE